MEKNSYLVNGPAKKNLGKFRKICPSYVIFIIILYILSKILFLCFIQQLSDINTPNKNKLIQQKEYYWRTVNPALFLHFYILLHDEIRDEI